MSSKVQICNMALSRIGADPITSLTENTADAKKCNTFFDDLADRVMVQGSWTSTISRATLAQTTTTPPFDYTYEYQLPVDPKCLHVLNVNDPTENTEYKIEGDKLLTDASSVKIRYISQLTDTESYGVLLTEAVEVLLSAYLAGSVTGDKEFALKLRREYALLIENNMALDNQQGSKDVIIVGDIISNR